MADKVSRRLFLISSCTLAFPGCQTLQNNGSETRTTSPPGTETTATETGADTAGTPAETETTLEPVIELNTEDGQINLFYQTGMDQITEQQIRQDSELNETIQTNVENAENLEEIRVMLNNGSEEEITEQQNPTQTVQTIQPGQQETTLNTLDLPYTTNRIFIEAETADGQTFESEPQIIGKAVPEAFRIDMKTLVDPETGHTENRGNYQTEFHFDNHLLNPERIQNQRQQWNQEEEYTELIEQLQMNPENIGETHDGNSYNVVFPNGEGYDRGNWSLEDFQETENVEDVLQYGTAVIQTHQHQLVNEGELGTRAFSVANDRNAATLETIINELHPPEEEEKITTIPVSEGGHGTVIAYADPEAENLDVDFPYLFVNTTTTTVTPIDDGVQEDVRGAYNPFIEGYSGEELVVDERSVVGYESQKEDARAPLIQLICRDNAQYTNFDPISMSDGFLEFVYNDHVSAGEPIEPIFEKMEEAVDHHLENGEGHVHIYGDRENIQYNQEQGTLENVYIADSNSHIHELSMDPETRLNVETMEEIMASAT